MNRQLGRPRVSQPLAFSLAAVALSCAAQSANSQAACAGGEVTLPKGTPMVQLLNPHEYDALVTEAQRVVFGSSLTLGYLRDLNEYPSPLFEPTTVVPDHVPNQRYSAAYGDLFILGGSYGAPPRQKFARGIVVHTVDSANKERYLIPATTYFSLPGACANPIDPTLGNPGPLDKSEQNARITDFEQRLHAKTFSNISTGMTMERALLTLARDGYAQENIYDPRREYRIFRNYKYKIDCSYQSFTVNDAPQYTYTPPVNVCSIDTGYGFSKTDQSGTKYTVKLASTPLDQSVARTALQSSTVYLIIGEVARKIPMGNDYYRGLAIARYGASTDLVSDMAPTFKYRIGVSGEGDTSFHIVTDNKLTVTINDGAAYMEAQDQLVEKLLREKQQATSATPAPNF